jgi:CheY-like chemotaxis protein
MKPNLIKHGLTMLAASAALGLTFCATAQPSSSPSGGGELRGCRPRVLIVMTGREQLGIRDAAQAGGAFAFLVKPFDDESFIALIRRAFDHDDSYGPKVP